MTLAPFQKKLCNALQNGLPIVARPFAEIARQLESDEAMVISETKKLIELGIIRRISATFNYRALGRVSTLAAAHVEESRIDSVAAAINELVGVSHNYLRDHYYNLWFTLQAASDEQIELILSKLSSDTDTQFNSLPAVHTFKLDVRFDAESDGTSLLDCNENIGAEDMQEVTLDRDQKATLIRLQHNLEIVGEPFGSNCDFINVIKSLFDKGVIRRIAAVTDYRKLGFEANAMFACMVEDQRVADVGRQLASSNNISHCYQRKTFPGWPFNLFAMMHGRSIKQLEQVVDDFKSCQKIRHFALLTTVKEFKKKPVPIER
jgi:DNA-binding Lrp family transcriptional regulator